MKAIELMIGDLIYEGSDHQIKISANYGRSVRYIEGKYTHEVEETYLNPIPLTEEILKANGWRRFSLGFTINNCGFCIGYGQFYGYPIMTKYAEDTFCYIKYVHELQHVLRVCELNELADNIKIE